MKASLIKHSHILHDHPGFRARQAATYVVAAVLLGVVVVLRIHAAGSFVSVEPEAGTAGNGAQVVADATASGTHAVQFGAGTGGATATCPKIVLAPYWYPNAQWTTAINTMPTGSFLILDISGSGAGNAVDPTFIPYVQAAQAKGIKVLGYSDTTYAARATATVETDVQNYKAWYGVTDIFLDQGSSSAADLPYYQTLYTYIHSHNPGSTVMINPGDYPDQGYMNVSDILMVYENTYSVYPGTSIPSWVSQYPAGHFAHVVHTTPSANLATALSLARGRNAGYVFVTDGTGANPYSQLPSYWSTELSDIAAACP